jgi:hypothetical protein
MDYNVLVKHHPGLKVLVPHEGKRVLVTVEEHQGKLVGRSRDHQLLDLTEAVAVSKRGGLTERQYQEARLERLAQTTLELVAAKNAGFRFAMNNLRAAEVFFEASWEGLDDGGQTAHSRQGLSELLHQQRLLRFELEMGGAVGGVPF